MTICLHFIFKSVHRHFALALTTVFLLTVMNPASYGLKRSQRLNFGTLAPRGTSYHQHLESLRSDWMKVSDGQVELKIFPDGTQGSEADMVRLMRVGMLQGGMFTSVGLSYIEPDVTALQNMPMIFRDLEEFDFVRNRIQPGIEEKFAEKGYVILFWMDSGWLRFFSRDPLIHPDEFKKSKFFVWSGEHQQIRILKELGYKPVPLESTDILTALQTGMITALPAPPFYALAGQFDIRAPNMLELNWVPLVGAAIVNKKSWDRIPGETQAELLTVAKATGLKLKKISRRESDEAVEAMVNRGLQVHPVTPEINEEWRAKMEAIYPEIREKMVPTELFDKVQQIIREYRVGEEKP